jgi:hypothetical protein
LRKAPAEKTRGERKKVRLTADDPIIVSTENRLERESTAEIQRILAPWIVTWVDQRDDFGRDGFIQLMTVDGVTTRVAPETCAMQAKSTAAPMTEVAGIEVETRHLAMWADDLAPPTLIAVWSKRSQELRIRTARELMRDVVVQSPDWRRQQTVTIHFRPEHSVPSARRLDDLRRLIGDEADTAGGQTRFHRTRRRILLPQLFAEGCETSVRMELETRTDAPNIKSFIGGGWNGPDLDTSDMDARRILLSALLLYEEIWMPLSLVGTALRLLGRERFDLLVVGSRLIFYASHTTAMFSHGANYVLGGLVAFDGPGGPDERFDQWTAQLENSCRSNGLATILHRRHRSRGRSVVARVAEARCGKLSA